MLVRVAYLIVSYSHDMSTINGHALLWHQPTELWVGCVDFNTQLPQFHY